MSSHCLSICLLVLLGATMTSEAAIQFITDNLKHNHDFVANALKLTQVDVIAEPLFTSVIRSSNSSCQRRDDVQLMSAALEVYTQVFSSIQKQQQNQDSLLGQVPQLQQSAVEDALKRLQQMMDALKKILKQMNREREEVMAKLKSFKVDDVLVQKKALAQFKAVYQAASLIVCGHAHSN